MSNGSKRPRTKSANGSLLEISNGKTIDNPHTTIRKGHQKYIFMTLLITPLVFLPYLLGLLAFEKDQFDTIVLTAVSVNSFFASISLYLIGGIELGNQ